MGSSQLDSFFAQHTRGFMIADRLQKSGDTLRRSAAHARSLSPCVAGLCGEAELSASLSGCLKSVEGCGEIEADLPAALQSIITGQSTGNIVKV